jgi:anti-sigma-K factor RskA
MAHGDLADLAWIEALGALDPEDRARLAAHLREGCPACLEALRCGNDVVAKLAHLFAPATPSDALRARIERHAVRRAPEAGAELRRAPRRARLASAASWVALGLAALVGAGAWREAVRLREQVERERAALAGRSAELARERSRGEALQREHEELSALLRAVAARDARAVALSGEGAAGARAFVSGEQLALFVHDLPSAPAGMTYQAWTIEDGVPRSAGVFDTGADGRARHRAALAAPIADDAAIAVTLEPAGGVPQPTGAMVLAQR